MRDIEPQATFLMTTYNAGEFLRPAIESLLAQTDPRWRLVIVDDGSTDGTADVAAEYRDPRVTLEVLEKNIGQTSALNLALGRVETTWAACLDQDDITTPDRLECQLAYMEAHPGTVLLGSWVDIIDENERTIGEWRPAPEPERVRRVLYAGACPFVQSSVLFRADVARSVGGFPVGAIYAQDLALWVAMEPFGAVALVPRVLAYYRNHAHQSSRPPANAARLLSEALSITETLPADLARERATARAWRARRLRLAAQLVIAAARAGNRRLARRSALLAARLLLADPLALVRIAGLGLRSVYRRTAYRISLG